MPLEVPVAIREYWPASKPDVEPYLDAPLVSGWFQAENKARLQALIAARAPRLLVELGAWYGASARFFLEEARDAMVISVDLWDKDLILQAFACQCPEFPAPPEMIALLDAHPIYETFLVNLWAFRDRLVPLKMTSSDGLQHVSRLGLAPDLIYVDASHEYHAVCGDVTTSLRLFPDATLCGDDYSWLDVKRAVTACAHTHGRVLRTMGEFWELA